MVGVRTVLVDDPSLTVRLAKGPNPKRIILDSRLRTPHEAKVLAARDIDKTIIATTEGSSYQKREEIERRGARVWVLNADAQGRVDLQALWKRMADEGITSVLVEGGNTLCSAVVRAGLADKVAAFVAPKLLGVGLPSLSDLGIGSMADALVLKDLRVQRVGPDVLVVGYLSKAPGFAEKPAVSEAQSLRMAVP